MPFTTLHLHLVTLWHPDVFLGCTSAGLDLLPCLKRNREELEHRREENARAAGVPIGYEKIHDRLTSHLGKPVYALRKTWTKGAMLASALREYDMRLIDTLEKGSQARWRCEFRSSWADEPGAWPPELVCKIINGIAVAPRVSIRQLWRNPTNARFGNLPLAVAPDSVDELANLIIGPYEHESVREARISFAKRDDAWWVAY